jgi:hypothetical protein
MKSKSFTLRGDKQTEFVRIIASRFKVYSESEITAICTLIHFDMFVPFFLDKHTRQKLANHSGLSYVTFNTCLSRLTKAGILGKAGGERSKSYYFNSAFRGLDEIDCIVFKHQLIES